MAPSERAHRVIQGRFDDSVTSLEQGFEIARAAGHRFLIALHSPQLGAVYAFIDRSGDAFAVLDTGLQATRTIPRTWRVTEANHPSPESSPRTIR